MDFEVDPIPALDKIVGAWAVGTKEVSGSLGIWRRREV